MLSSISFRIFSFSLGLALFSMAAEAASVGFIKNSSFYVITDIDKGDDEERRLDYAVGKFSMDQNAVVYLKGTTLWLIRDIRAVTPRPEKIETAVGSVKLYGDVIAYMKGTNLYVRRLSSTDFGGKLVDYSVGQFDVIEGTLVYRKNQVALYRVTDIDAATSERVEYPVGDFQLAR